MIINWSTLFVVLLSRDLSCPLFLGPCAGHCWIVSHARNLVWFVNVRTQRLKWSSDFCIWFIENEAKAPQSALPRVGIGEKSLLWSREAEEKAEREERRAKAEEDARKAEAADDYNWGYARKLREANRAIPA